ncbi:hypothetical protein IIU_06078 [Bacillus cereus VD133]|uniref:Uncharacterized protein n=1 Tax=Bacillus cereus VD133 TaxID=1053233 RepID=A0A9W5PKW7_BACCE|nr:hypothetical protein IIU_06078 [Bacillus cereus VD133]
MSEMLFVTISLILVLIFFCIVTFCIKKRTHHSILKLHPYLGRMRFLLEKIGPEFRQYWFDNDTAGKPFSRYDFQSVMFLAKYRSEILGFGSKRDFDTSGYYIANTFFPVLTEELNVNLSKNLFKIFLIKLLHLLISNFVCYFQVFVHNSSTVCGNFPTKQKYVPQSSVSVTRQTCEVQIV